MAEQELITEARALLLQFTRSGLKACHVATSGLEVAFSRDPAIGVAELLQPGQPPAAEPQPALVALQQSDLCAPHVGTLKSLVAVGTGVNAGDLFGEISLLDESVPLFAATSGVIAQHYCQPGSLVEFGQPLAVVEA